MRAGGWCDLEFPKETENFGVPFKRGEDLEKYLEDLVAIIERRVYNTLAKKTIFLLTRVNDQKFEFVASGNKDKDEDGNWRIIEVGGDLKFQKRISGTWTDAPSILGS